MKFSDTDTHTTQGNQMRHHSTTAIFKALNGTGPYNDTTALQISCCCLAQSVWFIGFWLGVGKAFGAGSFWHIHILETLRLEAEHICFSGYVCDGFFISSFLRGRAGEDGGVCFARHYSAQR